MARLSASMILATLLLLAMAFPSTEALGINCAGSSRCFGRGNTVMDIYDQILKPTDPYRQYANGQQIACTDTNICAFLQNYGGSVSAQQLSNIMWPLVYHGCKTCGSVPLNYPNSNDVTQGELTLNFVTSACSRQAGTLLCV